MAKPQAGASISRAMLSKECIHSFCDRFPGCPGVNTKETTDMPLGFTIDSNRLEAICQRYHVVRLELFGSRARGTARPDSDVDLLVTFDPRFSPGLEFVALGDELESCMGKKVDLLTRRSVEQSLNPIRRRSILATTEAVYAAA